MNTLSQRDRTAREPDDIPPLENGDHLDQATYHERHLAMAADVRAEFIGGIVYMASPQKLPDSSWYPLVGRWLDEYAEATPGTLNLLNPTVILGLQSELEPDACLLIRPECGGQTSVDKDQYLHGAPELIVEIARTTESIDLNAKKRDYEKGGVREYMVLALRQKQVHWFLRRRSKLQVVQPDAEGIYRSAVFPGFWLDAEALLRLDRRQLLATLRLGLNTTDHSTFVSRLGVQRPA